MPAVALPSSSGARLGGTWAEATHRGLSAGCGPGAARPRSCIERPEALSRTTIVCSPPWLSASKPAAGLATIRRYGGSAPGAIERAQLSDLFDEPGPGASTLLAPWTTLDLAAHLVPREYDYLAGPGLVLPGAWSRLAERRRETLALRDFAGLVAAFRSGPPRGFFRIGWVRRFLTLNEFFAHHEDVRRANGRGPRTGEHALDEAPAVPGPRLAPAAAMKHCSATTTCAATSSPPRATSWPGSATTQADPRTAIQYGKTGNDALGRRSVHVLPVECLDGRTERDGGESDEHCCGGEAQPGAQLGIADRPVEQ